MDPKHLVDPSSYLVMEDTADSEADFLQSEATAIFGEGDDDDAESCSCDASEVSGSRADVWDDDRDTSDQWNNPSQRSSTEEESWVDSGGIGSGRRDPSKEEMDAMEDKVFWEACMAIGYP
ncbi:hypothetical protein BT93_H2292 [Corymbia citriodora subsp. variegata]|nr:hypothetical protein BT93_H2292 [Corymbia citriodora subsp. variegata]